MCHIEPLYMLGVYQNMHGKRLYVPHRTFTHYGCVSKHARKTRAEEGCMCHIEPFGINDIHIEPFSTNRYCILHIEPFYNYSYFKNYKRYRLETFIQTGEHFLPSAYDNNSFWVKNAHTTFFREGDDVEVDIHTNVT